MSLELISINSTIGPTIGPTIVYTSSSSSSWSLLSFPYTRSEFKSMEYPIRFRARLDKSQSILPGTRVTLETTVWIEKEIKDYEELWRTVELRESKTTSGWDYYTLAAVSTALLFGALEVSKASKTKSDKSK
ncbi:hypothetical protein TrVE_jg8991 [Triparma verrucosa]|uniref:Uncharacterized protein n=1 Tax=Triparma verrucosa TaxID=1606542 RepID=A0A9W7BSZ5_9STRA|nr:hypothetical protein TrVE_jg8991 [Triparma verrucosa]